MNVRLWKSFVLVGMMLLASVYAPLRAMQDSTAVVPKTTERPFWMWQTVGSIRTYNFIKDFNQYVLQIQGDNPTDAGLNLTISPFNLMWNHNHWILSGNFNPNIIAPIGKYGVVVARGSASHSGFDAAFGVGYAVIDAARFRLYPMLSYIRGRDNLTISYVGTGTSLATISADGSRIIERDFAGIQVAVGSDYRIPLEYGDLYLLARIGYDFPQNYAWSHNGVFVMDADPNWFSRRGIFFQLGIGFGSERQ